MSAPTYGEIWNTLSKIDCSKQVDQKQGLTYLSWAWAWGILMEHYPTADWVELPEVVYPDGTVSVGCMIKIGDCHRTMRLPVMDHRNKAIANPDAWTRNKADMRCMVKALALFGLGHYIYAQEDLPAPVPLTEQQIAAMQVLLDKCPEGTAERVLKQFNVTAATDLPAAEYDTIMRRLRLTAA